jgi:hypothetical protein
MSLFEKYTTESVENVECLSYFSVCVQPCVQTSQMVLSLHIGIQYNELYKYKNTAIPVLTLRCVWGGGDLHR